MAFSKSLGIVLIATLLISFAAAQSPAPAPSSVGGRRISPASSPTKTSPTSPATALTPESSSSSSPQSPPSAISDSPIEGPGAAAAPFPTDTHYTDPS